MYSVLGGTKMFLTLCLAVQFPCLSLFHTWYMLLDVSLSLLPGSVLLMSLGLSIILPAHEL